jgi:type I restriction enzyme, S subunit
VTQIESWNRVRLADIQAPKKWALNGGPFGSKLVSRDYVDRGVPVIRGVNLPDDARFSLANMVFVSEQKADDLRANNAHPGDIVFTQRGTLGQVGLIPPDAEYDRFVISQSQMKLTVDGCKADPRYIYYYFRSPATVQRIHNLAFSSGVPHINLDILRNFEVGLPPLPTQRKIADILSAYDDLIENNTRRIAILEEMAQRLYREWFVHFRYPGHESVPLVESELGPIPEGWEVKRLGEVAKVNRWSITASSAPETIRYVDISSVGTGSIEKVESIQFTEAPSRARRCVQHGDIIWATVRPNCRSYSLILKPECNLIVSTGFAVISPTSVPYSYLYHSVTTDDFVEYLTNRASGSAYPAVNASDFTNAFILAPTPELLSSFDATVVESLNLATNLRNQNGNLQECRDLLLPKLISGDAHVTACPEPVPPIPS